MAKHIVMGTAGHVDHGKTALIKAITGIDTDRLKEEKERGITIDLGFAPLILPSGQIVSVVDVPGHERFIRNMVSGAAGIDMVAMVIAADEGIMPQSREHLAICALLGIRRGVVAVTKIDLVEKDWLDLVMDDIREFLKGTFLASSPIVPVSSVSGAGLPDFIAALDKIAAHVEGHDTTGLFRLPVDRVFTMKGFGTVLTGTLIGGVIQTGESVEVMPARLNSRIRGVQVHNKAVDRAEAGQRTAINLQGVDKTTIVRGDVLARPGTLEPTTRIDVLLEYLASADKKLKNRTLVRFHLGTGEHIARVILLDKDELAPGEVGYAQVILDGPTVALARDRFVIRSYSPVVTVGGGEIIDPLPRKHRRFSEELHRQSEFLQAGTDEERAAEIVERSGLAGVTLRELLMRTGVHQEPLQGIIDRMSSQGKVVVLDGDEARMVSFSHYDDLRQRMLRQLVAYHGRHPLKEGLPKEELRMTLGAYINPKLFQAALKHLEQERRVTVDREMVRMEDHRVNLKGELEDLRGEIAELYMSAGFAPPTMKEVMERFANQKAQASDVKSVLLKEGTLIKISEDLHLYRDVLLKLREDYRALLIREGKATPASFKELTGLSRKFIIPLMEYFDTAKLTIRAGDHRILRER